MRCFCDVGVRVPVQGELGLGGLALFSLLLDWFFLLALALLALLVGAAEGVAVLEDPLALA